MKGQYNTSIKINPNSMASILRGTTQDLLDTLNTIK